ncbi:MAG: class II histone deacetylase [Gammaproteobacteria bacterium]|nr:class II histone deacetylase [Gammaproteobacteria bacterium]
MNKTAFFWDERTFWHSGGQYAQLAPVGAFVQPMVAGGLPEAPETKRRLLNLLQVSGLSKQLSMVGADPADRETLLRVHPDSYLNAFKDMSDNGGGELGLRTPFGPGAYEIASVSAGLVTRAVESVVDGEYDNAYALSRPPGHHCLPDWPNGFCLFANIAIAVESIMAKGKVSRVAIVDWDVHHGNGSEHIFYNRSDVLTISIHQERCYPQDTGFLERRGSSAGEGFNMNIPLAPGGGHNVYLAAMDKLVLPQLEAFNPDLIVVACGFDAAGFDPLSRMMCTAETFRLMTRKLMNVSEGRLVMAHEGGYSEMYVPFCGHAVLEEMSGSDRLVEDPMAKRIAGQQPSKKVDAFHFSLLDDMHPYFAS